MSTIQQRRQAAPTKRVNFCSDNELLDEIAEEVGQYVGDVRYGSGTVDAIRSQIVFTLEDGRKLRLTAVFE